MTYEEELRRRKALRATRGLPVRREVDWSDVIDAPDDLVVQPRRAGIYPEGEPESELPLMTRQRPAYLDQPSMNPYQAGYQNMPPLNIPMRSEDDGNSIGRAIGQAIGQIGGGLIANKLASRNEIPEEFRATGQETRPRIVSPMDSTSATSDQDAYIQDFLDKQAKESQDQILYPHGRPSPLSEPLQATRSGLSGEETRPRLARPITRPEPAPLPETPPLLIRPRRATVASDDALPDTSVPPVLARRSVEVPPELQPFGASGESFGSTRVRRTQPRDYVADDAQYLRDLENQPAKSPNRFKAALKLGLASLAAGGGRGDEGIGNLIGRFIGGSAVGAAYPKGLGELEKARDVDRAKSRLSRSLAIEKEQTQAANDRATVFDKINKAPESSTRIVGDEYPGVQPGTEIRQSWDPRRREMVDVRGRDGKPVISKIPTERAAAREIKYNRQGQAVLVSKDTGTSSLIFEPDGVTPLTKNRAESGNVQTAVRLGDDGITQIQMQYDPDVGEWVDSVVRGGGPLVRGRVPRIDTATGAPASAVMTNNRITTQEQQENARKRASYENETLEWGNKEKTLRQNKTNEDEAIRGKTERLRQLYQEQPRAYGGLTGGTRTAQEIETEKAQLIKELETHRSNANHFQSEAEKAANSATEARRNAGMYASPTPTTAGRSTVIGRPPAQDGKRHYTRAEIQAEAEAHGKSFEQLYQVLKSNPNVVIDR